MLLEDGISRTNAGDSSKRELLGPKGTVSCSDDVRKQRWRYFQCPSELDGLSISPI